MAMSEALAISDDQVSLIKRTIANGATTEELKLFFYDCQRHGVHPLDRMIHFTKRGGRYTPITSIDLMRTRAADTGEMAGSDDAAFITDGGKPVEATVTVYRITQGQRFGYSATARWDEYYPGEAQGHMWKKMPKTMLAKCAEALALRKAFPKQLHGLYAREEMDQAGPLSSGGDTTTIDTQASDSQARRELEVSGSTSTPDESPAEDGSVLVAKVEEHHGTNAKGKPWTKYAVTFDDGQSYSTFAKTLAEDCRKLQAAGSRVIPVLEEKGGYTNLVSLRLLDSSPLVPADAEPEQTGEENHDFILAAVKRDAAKHAITSAEGDALGQYFLKGKRINTAAYADLRALYLFLGDEEAVKGWRKEQAERRGQTEDIPF